MLKKIVVATEKTGFCTKAVSTAVEIARRESAGLIIVHILHSVSGKEKSGNIGQPEGRKITAGEYIDKARKTLSLTCQEITKGISKVDYHVTTGIAWEEILKISRKEKAGLIVMGPHETKEKDGGFHGTKKIGSTVTSVIAHENCPVMITGERNVNFSPTCNLILVCIDFSISCEYALKFASDCARKFGSRLILFHMLTIPPFPKYSSADYDADIKSSLNRLQEFCWSETQDIRHDYIIKGGAVPHAEILECAEKQKADLIVLGSHTKSEDGKWYAGSAVERVGSGSACPVIVVSDPDALMAWDESITPFSGADKDRRIHLFSKESREL